MIIYIYGNDTFKKEIRSVLNHSNIKFRLDEHGEIKELNSLGELKKAIKENPKNIYLIDDDKIIKKNSLNQKIKFLKPKDGIEQEYLLDNGIGDISVDSIEELSKHIIRKLESFQLERESNDIQDSIVEIVEDAYENSDDEKEYIQLDDELGALLTHESNTNEELFVDDKVDELPTLVEEQEEEEKNIENIDNDFSGLDDELTTLLSLGEESNTDELKSEESEEEKDLSELEDLSFDEDLDNIINTDENTKQLISEEVETLDNSNFIQGESMADEFSEFDALNEDDILAALNDIDDTTVSTQVEPKRASAVPTSASQNISDTVDLSSSNVNDIAELISKLLNNKTLEITIKVKN